MKTVENKTAILEIDNPTALDPNAKLKKEVKYTEWINNCVKHPPVGGFDYDEMKKRDKLFDKVQDNNVAEIVFEDAEYDHLVQLVKQMKWGIFNKSITDFSTYIIELKK